MKKIVKKKGGIVFWITGLSGSGKSTIGKAIKKDIINQFGPTLLFNGDDLRRIFKINSYDKESRLELGKKYSKFCKFITEQNINIIFTAVGLFNELHKLNRKILKNYIEIYIKSDIKKLINLKKRNFYIKKKSNVWGLDIRPEYPKKPHIIVNNNFKIKIETHKKNLVKRIIDLVR